MSRDNLRLKVLSRPLETASVGESYRIDGEMWGTLLMFCRSLQVGFFAYFCRLGLRKNSQRMGERSQGVKNRL